MGEITGIQWTDSTHNFWYGCNKVSPGCKFCYAEREMKRFSKDFGTITRAKGFSKPLTWKEPRKVFINSWSDFFIDQADEWRDEAWEIIRHTPHLTYQILTKRPENIPGRLPFDWGDGWKNVWLGVSVENQDYEYRIDELLQAINWSANTITFVSYEPALGPLDLDKKLELGMVNWVISGGESGADPRPADPDWFESMRDQCARYDVAYFHKQNGGSRKIDGAYGGNLLDGEKYEDFPKRASRP